MRVHPVLAALLLTTVAFAQQVVQRGPLGRPAQVMDETGQWTAPYPIATDHDVEIYIPDLTSPDWLKRNYDMFQNRGQYVVSFFTFYRTPKACRANQIAWGFSDSAHLDACIDIAYRVRQATVDPNLKTVTLIMAAMVGQDGGIDPASVQTQPLTRRWAELDANTQKALTDTTAIVTRQMAVYDRKRQSTR